MSKNAVCTVITKSYLPYARTLASSLAKYNPDVDLYVLLADKVDGYFDPSLEPFKFIYLEDLSDTQTVEQMCFYYTPFELCCALRGFLHEYMFEQTNAQKWLFLDSDIMIYNSLDIIFQQLEESSIILNPHLKSLLNEEYVESVEAIILVSGLYNAGFLGLKLSDETSQFIQWFKDRLKKYSFNRRGKKILNLLFVDQLWLNFVPLFFKNVGFLNNLGANVAYWSLVSSKLIKKNSTYYIDDKPLLFFHFTGWDIYEPAKLSKYLAIDVDLWRELGENYQNLLFKYYYEEARNYPYAFSSFTNGEEIHPDIRYLYFELLLSNPTSHINPFSEESYQILKSLQKRKKNTLLNRLKEKIRKYFYGK